MAALTKSNVFTRDLLNGAHRFSTDTIKVMLTNTAPSSSTAVKADVVEIAAGNGYTAGGLATAASVSTASAVAKLTLADVTFTAATANMADYRYAVVYNDTQTTPAKPVIGWYDRGVTTTLLPGDYTVLDFDDTNGVLTIA